MRIKVLGSAAGGGFPQWNCNCKYCHGVRHGTLKATPRTQSSIAVSKNGGDWLLINASPDIRAQLEANSELQPKRSTRDTAIRSIILVDSQIDHTTGLLSLREGRPLEVYCTKNVYNDLTENFPIFEVLSKYCNINYHPISMRDGFTPIDGVRITAVDVESKAPPYSPHRQASVAGDNIGLIIEDTASGKKVFYAPGLGEVTEQSQQAMLESDCVFVDGTFWTENDMEIAGVGTKRAQEMGHLPLTGAGGMLDNLRPFKNKRRILIHINNTNPILVEDSAEREQLKKEGIEVAYDGMEVVYD